MSSRITAQGRQVFAFASYEGKGTVHAANSDLGLRINNDLWKVTMLPEDNYHIKDSRYDVVINDGLPHEE